MEESTFTPILPCLRFALIGAAGFVAPRHLQAIKDVGGKLVAALDPHDGVGALDHFDKDTEFFTDEHAFERHLERMNLAGNPVDWVVVCSPNFMHFSHIKMGLWCGARVLCEKPLVVNPNNLDRLVEVESAYNGHAGDHRVFTVLQLRHAPMLQQLRAEVAIGHHNVRLVYTTPRGRWYERSWKGDVAKSGGIITNIGIHMLDLLLWLFGPVSKIDKVDIRPDTASGRLILDRADVEWDLSINRDHMPERTLSIGPKTWSINGFENLHTAVYRETLAGRGHTIEDARPAVELAARLR